MGGQKLAMPFGNPTTYAGHSGIDFAQPAGTPIRAVADGEITYSAWLNSRAGYTRTLTTPSGTKLLHCHLVNLNGPRIGSRVRAGDVIAYVGSTGYSTGPHLHHELYVNGALQAGDNYWKYIDRNRVIGSGSAAGGSGEGDDMSAKAEAQIEQIYAAIFNGGKSMHDQGRSMSYSLGNITSFVAQTDDRTKQIADAVKPIRRDGKDVPLRQEIADIKTMVIGMEAAVRALAVANGADPDAILKAVQDGVENAMRKVTFSADVDS